MNNLVVPPQFKDLIFVAGEQAQTTSLLVAGRFNKNHKDVLRAISNLECSMKFRAANIEESSYVDDKGREQKLYVLTKDGFYKLANSFSGPLAMEWQERFLDAFNWMQSEMYRLYQENVNLKAKQHIGQIEQTANLYLLGKLNDAQPRTDYRIKQFERQAAKCLALAEKGQQMYDSCTCQQARLSRTGWRKLIKDDDVSKFLEFGNEVKSLFPDYPDFDPGIDDLI